MSEYDLHVTAASRLEASYFLSGTSKRLRKLLANRMVWIEPAQAKSAEGQICIQCTSNLDCLDDDMREARRLICKQLPQLEICFVSRTERWWYDCSMRYRSR